jgi:hypothetical protein
MKRTRFTKRELDLILTMAAIAGANPPEGDYQEWTERDYRTLERLREKIWDRLYAAG